MPILYHNIKQLENVFKTCCGLHNEILRESNIHYLWEHGINWEEEDGNYDIADLHKELVVNQEINGIMKKVSLRLHVGLAT